MVGARAGTDHAIPETAARGASVAVLDKNARTLNARQYHLHVSPGDVAPYVLLPGDPARVLMIADHLDDPREIAFHREYRTVTGRYKGIEVSGTSTGIGCPSAAIAVEELANVGATHFIRVGSSAAYLPGMAPGDLVVNTAAMRLDGTSAAYVDPRFPAVADHFLVRHLIDAARDLAAERGFGVHVGINASSDAFYAETPEFVEELRKHRVSNVEMESSAIFTIAHLRGLFGAMVCAVSYNYMQPDKVDFESKNHALVAGWDNAIDVALDAIARYEADHGTS
ncbi:MAG: nucleoside phosphorylase [Acidimicrobiaceae bacterium]|nr:nucleoside phosphorylase [Acidimicrobiaceae bacterium]